MLNVTVLLMGLLRQNGECPLISNQGKHYFEGGILKASYIIVWSFPLMLGSENKEINGASDCIITA